MRWLRQWWPAIVWAIVIFGFSTGVFASENTSRIIVPILHWLFPHAPATQIAYYHRIVRKCGHVTEYFILSLLILHGIRAGRRGMKWSWVLLVIALVACYAVLDEFHQSFVPGRGGLELDDVLLDTTGGAAGQLLAFLAGLCRRMRSKTERREIEA